MVIYLTKEVKDLYTEKYRTQGKQIEEETNGELFHVHELEELILLKYQYYPKQSTDSMQFLSKFQSIFHRTRTNNSKICMEPKRSWITKAISIKKNKAGVIMLPDFKL